ncbi:MAG: hypothetical protein LBF63_04175, partial [Treponema sp.]|nr:hypothetical protein [Treponema sp.]
MSDQDADPPVFRGFLVHAYAQTPWSSVPVSRSAASALPRPATSAVSAVPRPGARPGRLYLLGRLDDGRSFAAAVQLSGAGFHISAENLSRCAALLTSLPYRTLPPRLQAFSGSGELVFLDFDSLADRALALRVLTNAGILSPDGAEKPAETFLMERQIHGRLEIQGPSRPGRHVDLVFADPRVSAPPAAAGPGLGPSAGVVDDHEVPLRVASIDIETDTTGSGAVLAVGIAWADARRLGDTGDGGGRVRVLVRGESPPVSSASASLSNPAGSPVVFHRDEASLLRAFIADIRGIDPDVLTGWNILDFDLARLSERCARLGIPFCLGRSEEPAKYFPAGNKGGGPEFRDRNASAAALVPGRQVLDALRIFRTAGRGFLSVDPAEEESGSTGGFSLEAVSQRVL